jgi:hypothetical protein
MIARLVGAGRFLWGFLIGEDWRLAAGVVASLAATGLLAGAGVAAWWVLPLGVLTLLVSSVWLAARRAS